MTVEELLSLHPQFAETVKPDTLRQWKRRGSVPMGVTKALARDNHGVTKPAATPETVTKGVTKRASVTRRDSEPIILSDGQVFHPDPAYVNAPPRYPVPDDAPIPACLAHLEPRAARGYMRIGMRPDGFALTASEMGVGGRGQ
jgi:hypothetical protein